MQNNHWPDSKQFWRGKRVIISGGAGFLGSFVVEKLAERGVVARSSDYDLTRLTSIRQAMAGATTL